MTIYELHIQGHLDQHWSAWFEDLTITYQEDCTVLRGPLADEAALHGVLIKIRDLALPLLLLKREDLDASGQP
ncbi:MAG: hypothetical protein J2P37_03820 [Ktedonobacteraceae bacterium]|nr:hypothetical protein [Ktedonobacteraceae bacterium]